jgi:membrane protease YdiL (CAAX protease family)
LDGRDSVREERAVDPSLLTAPSPALARGIARHPLISYFVLAFAGTWSLLALLALGRGEHGLGLLPVAIPSGADFLLAMLSAYAGPLLAAVLVTAAAEGRAGLRRLRGRIVRWRFGLGWYLLALLAPLAIWLGTYSVALGGQPLVDLIRQPSLLLATFLPFVALGFFMPSLGEELGWRGFALPRLQERFGPMRGTLLLGALHALWHLPMFFTPNLGPFTAGTFITFSLTAVVVTVLYTWVTNRAGGSVLPAILLHASGNAASGLLNRLVPEELPLDGWARVFVEDGWLAALGFGLVALALVTLTRGRLGYRPEEAALAGAPHRNDGAVPRA